MRNSLLIPGVIIVFLIALSALMPSILLTEDQKAFLLFKEGKFSEAGEVFVDPRWKASALYRDAEFKEAGEILKGFNKEVDYYNRGTVLIMGGRYAEAVKSFDQALKLRPDWPEAETNRDVALARMEMTKKEGANQTEGDLGADDYVFDKNKKAKTEEDDSFESKEPIGKKDINNIWLRGVNTRPADFLKSKFSYQYATEKEAVTEEQESVGDKK